MKEKNSEDGKYSLQLHCHILSSITERKKAGCKREWEEMNCRLQVKQLLHKILLKKRNEVDKQDRSWRRV